MRDRFDREEADPFWYSVLEVATEAEIRALANNRTISRHTCPFQAEWTFAMVRDLLVTSGVNIWLHEIADVEENGTRVLRIVRQFGPADGHFTRRSIVRVSWTDRGEFRPSWIPATSFDRNGRVPWTPTDEAERLRLRAEPEFALWDAPPPLEDEEEMPDDVDVWQAFLAEFEAAVDLFEGRDPLPDPYADMPELRQIETLVDGKERNPLDGIYRAVGVYPPPFGKQSRYYMGCGVVFHRILEPNIPLMDSGDCVVEIGPPGPFQRAASRCTGRGGIAWELRPSVIPEMHIDSKHLVYVVDILGDVPSIDSPALLSSGDYSPALFGRLVTETGTFALIDPVEILWKDMGLKYTFFGLKRTAATFLGSVARMLPFHLEPVMGHSTRFINRRYLPQRDAYPDDKTFMRTRFAILAQFVPEQLKGPFLEVRNTVMAKMEDPVQAAALAAQGFDPLDLARQMIEDLRVISRQAGAKATVPRC